MAVQFEDNSMRVMEEMNDAAIAYLYESAESLASQTASNSRVGTGQLKNSWTYKVDESKLEAVIGSPLQNAIWEEFGTGEYALKGDGRKGGWFYRDEKTGEFRHTYGKTPNRALQNAFNTLKNAIINRAIEVLKSRMEEGNGK